MPNRRLFALAAFLATVAHAQWLNFPTPGTPRTRDGKPNLAAPVPRALDGKPDLSGVWMHETTSVADVKRLFGSQYDADITLAPPGMEIGTQHKYAFDILADFKPGDRFHGANQEFVSASREIAQGIYCDSIGHDGRFQRLPAERAWTS